MDCIKNIFTPNAGNLPFRIENYQSKYANWQRVTQVALYALVATGITLSILSGHGYVVHTFKYIAAWGSVPALVALGIFTVFHKIKLLHAIYHTTSSEELVTIMNIAEIKVSFLGKAYIQVSGMVETVDVDYVTQHLIDNLKQKRKVTQGEKLAYSQIGEKIHRIYTQSSELNCFTYCMAWIRGWGFTGYMILRGRPYPYTTGALWAINHEYEASRF